MDFKTLPAGPLRLINVTLPACLADKSGDLVPGDLLLQNGNIVTNAPSASTATTVDMGGAMVFPAFTDMHTHLDKGHIWPRSPNPDGTFMGALTAVRGDTTGRWTAQDVRQRADFSLRCAYAHGTAAIRTHLDSIPPQDAISWPVFAELRETWAGRVDLQATCLIGCEGFSTDGGFARTADIVAEHGGVLGMVTYPVPDIDQRIRDFFSMAAARGLSADFHVDETLDTSSNTLRQIAQAVIDTGYDAPVVVGHCCSVSAMQDSAAMETLDLVARAGLHVVSLPMCNLYLQDRHAHRTPRMRGLTLVHEMKARGINVSFASDNIRDPFYAYGDLDMVEVMREATRLGHLDHSGADWPQAFTSNPRAAMGLAPKKLTPGNSADLVIFKARNWTELLSRPQSDRIVLRDGKQIDRTLPDYAELDHLMGTP